MGHSYLSNLWTRQSFKLTIGISKLGKTYTYLRCRERARSDYQQNYLRGRGECSSQMLLRKYSAAFCRLGLAVQQLVEKSSLRTAYFIAVMCYISAKSREGGVWHETINTVIPCLAVVQCRQFLQPSVWLGKYSYTLIIPERRSLYRTLYACASS